MAYNTECENWQFPVGTRVRHATDASCCSGLIGTVVPGPACSYGVTVNFDGPIEHKHYISTENITKEA